MYTGVIFAKQPSHVWESVFRTLLLLASFSLLLRTGKKSKIQLLSQLSIL